MGAAFWNLFASGGMLVWLFSMVVPNRDANMEAQQRRAVSARHVGDLKGVFGRCLYVFFLHRLSAP